MRPYVTLFVKEWKGMRLAAGALLVATLAIVLQAVHAAGDGDLHAGFALLLLPYLCPPLTAGLLIHSVSSEWGGGTQHQWLALPLSRAALLLTKVAAVLSLAAAVFVLSTVGVHYIHDRIVVSLTPFFPPLDQVTGGKIWALFGSFYGAFTIYLVGLACMAVAVRVRLTRFAALTTIGVFLLGFWLSGQLAPVTSAVGALFMGGGGPTEQTQVVYLANLHRTLMGMLFAAAGAWLFARHVEA